jgi:hypothetical protein
MRNILILILLLIALSCQTDTTSQKINDDEKLEYISIRRTIYPIDTISRSLIREEYQDSIYRLSYLCFRQQDTLDEKFELPISNSKDVFYHLTDTSEYRLILLDEKMIRYVSNDYTVYKYLFDVKNADDEEMLYFFLPEFGIVIHKSAWWGNYDRLIDNGKVDDRDDIFFITEMIIFDSDFFHKY